MWTGHATKQLCKLYFCGEKERLKLITYAVCRTTKEDVY